MKDRKNVIQRLRARIKPESRRYVQKNMDIAQQVRVYLEAQGLTQKEFAQRLGKQPSEVSRWLSGLHNLTLESITKMEAELNADIIMTPDRARDRFNHVTYFTVHAQPNQRYKPSPREEELQRMVASDDPALDLVA
ncbi:MAG: helix-turn-helix transcriptional regulator [Flavobacteriales bacterium]|nr:helix-turn-helix transcriptional regulator [Flavobacteriales bacterium]MCB0784567.1 helix-turn-helix transcriptional regulator [Flavobacteriales bacterium]